MTRKEFWVKVLFEEYNLCNDAGYAALIADKALDSYDAVEPEKGVRHSPAAAEEYDTLVELFNRLVGYGLTKEVITVFKAMSDSTEYALPLKGQTIGTHSVNNYEFVGWITSKFPVQDDNAEKSFKAFNETQEAIVPDDADAYKDAAKALVKYVRQQGDKEIIQLFSKYDFSALKRLHSIIGDIIMDQGGFVIDERLITPIPPDSAYQQEGD